MRKTLSIFTMIAISRAADYITRNQLRQLLSKWRLQVCIPLVLSLVLIVT